MPSRESALYKDKIEVSLDGRQIFYLFFGGAVIIGLVFVLGVMTGRRVEARGHVDRADTQSARDPLAALDRLEKSESLSFRHALMGTAAPTDVEKTIDEIEKRRTEGAGKVETRKSDAAKAEPGKSEATKAETVKADAASKSEPVTRPDADKPRADRHDGEKKAKKHDADVRAEGKTEGKSEGKSDKSEPRADSKSDGKPEQRAERSEPKPDAKSESKSEPKSESKPDAKSDSKSDTKSAEAKVRFTLQLSSFQDKAEAEAFLASTKSSGFQAYLIEADVSGKGTFYRVRLGSYRSLDAANDAKADYEKSAKKNAQVMRL
jgi:DedD protein